MGLCLDRSSTLLTSTNSQFSLYIKAFLFLWPHFGQLFKIFYSTTALNGVALVMFSSVIILSLFSIQFCYRQNRLLHVAKYNKSTDQLVKGKRWVPEWGRWIHHRVFLCAWGWSVFLLSFYLFKLSTNPSGFFFISSMMKFTNLSEYVYDVEFPSECLYEYLILFLMS